MRRKHSHFERLDVLADGIFSIVMTILVFEIKIPEIIYPANGTIFYGLYEAIPLFLSYLLAFVTLFNYWRGYHSVVSEFVKRSDVTFQNLAGTYLLFVALIPFSSHMLGLYHFLPAGVIIFSGNVIIIGVILLLMRIYAWRSRDIENKEVPRVDQVHSYIRTLFPIIFSIFAIIFSFVNTKIALIVLTLAIIFNLLKGSTAFVCKIFKV